MLFPILFLLSMTSWCQDVPSYLRDGKANQDYGGLNSNFQDLATRNYNGLTQTVTPNSCPNGAPLTGAVYNSGKTYGGSCTGGITFTNKTIAQLQSITPNGKGESYFCTDCSPAKVVTSTGTSSGNFADAIGGTFK